LDPALELPHKPRLSYRPESPKDPVLAQAGNWRNPATMLILMSVAMPLAFSVWNALLNNFAIEAANFDGAQIGLLQSIREIPGFLAFTAVFLLLLWREQTIALMSLTLLGLGVAVTGPFAFPLGLYLTTFFMSLGFHFFETVKQSLALQWLDPEDTPEMLGRMISAGAATALGVYAGLWLLLELIGADFVMVYAIGGGLCLVLVAFMALGFPAFSGQVEQHRHLVLRRRYWLYYALTFMSGARRQIFMVFASFLLVQKFGYSASDVAVLFLINHGLSWFAASRIGRWIGRIGERRALTIEYLGLIVVFVAYAVVEDGRLAAALYVIDHVFFAMAIAIKTYFQKIADPADIAGSAGVAFTINHIAAVVIPVSFGLIWLKSPPTVFWLGAGMAVVSLALARMVPNQPLSGQETRFTRPAADQGNL
jgi:predicted MFS family arabinose efflux permease